MSNKILFIDGQVFQSAAWDRGMGKYSLELLKSMIGQKSDYDQVNIIFTKDMPLKAPAKQRIVEAVPDAKLIFGDLTVPFDSTLADIPELQKQNQAVLDGLIANHSQPEDKVVFLLLALFIEQVCSVFPSQGHKIILFYDLIPLQYNDLYGKLTSYQNYLARYKTIFEADTILTISQTVADDVALNLGISPQKITNIDGAPIKRDLKASKKPNVKLPKRFVLMPSGDDLRKNNDRAVQGFEAYLHKHPNEEMALVLTSHFQETTQRTLQAYSEHSIFTGNVSEEELLWLYEHAEALLFVPEYEGLGLPILEAAEVDKPIVCSDLTVFNEMSSKAFYYCDPFDPFSIADALDDAISNAGFSDKLKEYPAILKKYTWSNTAEKAARAIKSAVINDAIADKPRIAILTPSPNGYSAIGKLVMQLHPAMQQYFDIDYYTETGRSNKLSRPNYLPYIANVYPASDFGRKKYKQYDAVLYHIGNSEFHLDTIKSALYLPGYAVFHDSHLKDVFKGELLAHGYITQNRFDAECALDKAIANPKTSFLSSVVNNQQALIAHSDYTQDALSKTSAEDRPATLRLNLPTAIPERLIDKKADHQISIGLAGIIHPDKGLKEVEAIAQSSDFYDYKINIFGLSLVPDEVINRLQDYPNVEVYTNITDFQFQRMLSELDILINFRPDYKGETSLATIEALRFGVIPVVRKIGWYDELPDDCVLKISKAADLMLEIKSLIDDPVRRAAMKQAARKFISENHSYQNYAKTLYDFMMQQELPDNKVNQVATAFRAGRSKRSIKKLWQA